jgi:hypothetical protein
MRRAACTGALGQAGGMSASERLWPRLAAFFALAAFASLRYADLLTSPPAGRIVGVVACATAGCAALALSGRLATPGRVTTALRALIVLGALALSLIALGLPAHLVQPGGWGSLVHHVRGGVDQLGSWLWPYRGGDRWARTAVLLVLPATLVLAGALCFWPSRAGAGTRRPLALLALLAIFLMGAANTPGYLPAVQGLALLVLSAGLLLGAVHVREAGRATRWLGLCALAALLAQAALGSAHPWLNYRDRRVGSVNVAAGVSFQWNPSYGPIRWSRSGETIFTVADSHPALLRVTSLDRFDGVGFLRSQAPPGSAVLDIGDRAARARWTQSATVDLTGLRSQMLVSGGGVATSARWLGTRGGAISRQPDGTVEVAGPAPAEALYQVNSYAPRPSAARARAAPSAFPRSYLPYTQFELPAHAGLVGGLTPDPAAAQLIEASPYAPMFALAQRLAAGAGSSYDVATQMTRFLRSNYVYDEHVPLTRYPLESFLFEQRRGYCEQFAGAMTLMLRMDGIPARVGEGFRPAVYESAAAVWLIRPVDAHAWVEVFVTGVGWVTFDPTPAAPLQPDGAAGESVSRSVQLGGGAARSHTAAASAGRTQARRAHPSGAAARAGTTWALLAGALLLLLAAAAWLAGRVRLRRALAGDADGAIAELHRALGQSGEAVTLAQLEDRLRRTGHVRALAYVRTLRMQRYGDEERAHPSRAGRAALRRALGASIGRIRVLLAMPPGWSRR